MARILLVEDNEANREVLFRRLTKKGHHVIVATNGQEAIDLANHEDPDLILMDMKLPEVDGWEVTRVLKGKRQTQAIPIIALTAHVFQEDKDRSLEAGVDDFDTKPVRFPRLQAKIDALLAENPELRDRYR